MRYSRIVPIAASLALLLSAAAASALYTPNPAGRWPAQRFFLAGDFQILEKDLDPGGEIDDTVGFFVRPSFSVARNVTLYARLGFQDADDVEVGFAGGFGIQGSYVLPGHTDWAIGGSFDYLHWSADIGNDGPDIDWNEFQIAPAVSYNIPSLRVLTPYAGLLFDFVDARRSLGEDDPVGLLLGTSFDPDPRLRVEGQVRFISETGLFLSVGYLF